MKDGAESGKGEAGCTHDRLKVGLFLPDVNPEIDCRHLDLGNPGIGGTPYVCLALPWYFRKYFNHVEFVLFAKMHGKLPPEFNVFQAGSEADAALQAKRMGCAIFLFCPRGSRREMRQLLDALARIEIKTILLAENTLFSSLRSFAKHPFIVRYVNVGKEQYDMLRDHQIIYKSAMIYNLFEPLPYIPKRTVNKQNSVVYVGALVYAKSFHVLAHVWKKVLAAVPDAKLDVIGGGGLYGGGSRKLGKWGIAEEKYERLFRPFLSDCHGRKLDSVTFHGVLGNEKIAIMQTAKVGCPNPTAWTETFGYTAVELQACRTPVVSRRAWGYLDTVSDGQTGLLGESEKDLAEQIITLLKDEDLVRRLGTAGPDFVTEKFSASKICKQWSKLFDEAVRSIPAEILPIDQNPNYEMKQFSERIRKIKEKCPFLWSIVPSYMDIRPFGRIPLKLFGLACDLLRAKLHPLAAKLCRWLIG